MPQETNLNVAPYFDDFDRTEDYYRVLFKPGYPVQARELTTLQSILQNQIEQFAGHFFKEGTAISGGQINYIANLPCVQVEDSYNSRSLTEYAAEVLNTVIIGSKSGVRARVEAFLPASSSERGYDTFYVSYLSSNAASSRFTGFIPGEDLLSESGFQTASALDRDPGDSPDGLVENLDNLIVISRRSGFAKCIAGNPNAIGSAVVLNAGTYYIRGHFVEAPAKTLLLDQYSTQPSYKVGFFIYESIDTFAENEDLLDNAQGYPNFTAPGADRLQIEIELVKIDVNEKKDLKNFVQILEIRSGVLQNQNRTTEYTRLADELARRTFDQAGNFYVKPPSLSVRNSLNDRKGNNGLFNEGESTLLGQTPSDSLGVYSISPLKAYIQGYEVETVAPSILDFQKPRTTKTLTEQSVTYFTGPTFVVNRVYGYPTLGITTSFYVSLRDSRSESDQTIAPGKEIGVARVFDYELETGSYNAANANLNEWDVSLYDVQSYTELTLNEPVSLPIPTSIKGKSSGATAHLRYSTTNSGILTAYNISGRFSVGEKLFFNGVENPRVTRVVKEYSTSDVKSLYGVNSNGTYFCADTKLYSNTLVGQVTISPNSSGISTVTSTTVDLNKVFNVGDICAYSDPSSSTVVYSKVTAVSVQTINIAGIATVTGINQGALPASQITPSDFRKIAPSLQRSTDNTLYTLLPKRYVSSVNLNNSSLTIRKTYPVAITGGVTNLISAGTDLKFLPFDAGRYILTRDDGTFEVLTEDKFAFGNGFKELTILGLGSNTTGVLVATLEKKNVKNKTKVRNKVASIIIDKSRDVGSGIGTTTLNDGLTYGNFPYGTRVQDEEICLNYPDVTKILGIYESDNLLEPDLRKLRLLNLNGTSSTTADLIVGEEFVGQSSGAVGIFVKASDALTTEFIYLNTATFRVGEKVRFKESRVQADIVELVGSDLDITSKYTLDSGYRNTIYDYSRIVRNQAAPPPTKKLKIVFEYASYKDSDNADITTVDSYSNYDYCDIPKIDGISNADIIDIRPRVDPYNVASGSRSPFEFFGRSFDASNNSSEHILASDELITLDYSYYLPRIDRIFLDRTGQFHLVKGEPAENPTLPAGKSDAIEIATISLPAYLCDISLANVTLAEYKRYQMQDIKKLEDRIKNLEYYTSLSLLESDTSNLFIGDNNGLNRFKSGFFVDNFESAATQLKVTGVKNCIDVKSGELRAAPFTTEIDLLLGTFSSLGIGTDITSPIDLDYRFDTNLIGENVRKSGNVITIDYDEVVEIFQRYATDVVPVASYADVYYAGNIELVPTSDTWVDQVKLEPNVVDVQGKYTKTTTQLTKDQFNAQSGFGPVFWNSWETTWTGETQIPKGTKDTLQGYDIVRETLAATKKTGTSTKQGFAEKEIDAFNKVSLGQAIISTDFVKSMRSRNIEFIGKKLKPLTRVYPFFDKIGISKFCVPKLLEVQMISGVFQVGETVKSLQIKVPSAGNGAVVAGVENPYIQFRLAASNHKSGPFNLPRNFYTTNPYNSSELVPSSYSTTSRILNVDTFSLANQPQGEYYGYVTVGMTLVGQTSGARARVTDIRFITDYVGEVAGNFHIPDSNVPSNPKFETGTKIFRLTSQPDNVTVGGIPTCGAEEKFFAEGQVRTTQENVLSVRNVQVVTATLTETKPAIEIGEPFVVSSTIVGNIKPPPPPTIEPEPQPPIDPPPEQGPGTPTTPTPTPGGSGGGGETDTGITDPGPIVIPPEVPDDKKDSDDDPNVGEIITTTGTEETVRVVNPEKLTEEQKKVAKVTYVFDKKGNALPVWYVPYTYKRGRKKGETALLTWDKIKKNGGRKAANRAFKEAGYPKPPRNYPGSGKPVKPTGGKDKSTKIKVTQQVDGSIKVVDVSKKAKQAKKQGKSNVIDVINPGDPDYGFYNKGELQLWKHGATLIATQHPEASKRVTRRGEKKFEDKGYPVGKLPLQNGSIRQFMPPVQNRRENARPRPDPRPLPLANQNRVIGGGYPVRPRQENRRVDPPRPARPASPPPPPVQTPPARVNNPRPNPPPPPAPSRGGGGGGGGGSGGRPGRKSDMNLKMNITIIDNALNRLMNI